MLTQKSVTSGFLLLFWLFYVCWVRKILLCTPVTLGFNILVLHEIIRCSFTAAKAGAQSAEPIVVSYFILCICMTEVLVIFESLITIL